MSEHLNYVESIRQAEQIYSSSILQGKWLGTEAQAHRIYERFLDRIEIELLAKYKNESFDEYEKHVIKRRNSETIYMIPIQPWIYADKIVKYAISKRIHLNKFESI